MRICSRCGQQLNDQQIFCHKCGLQVQRTVQNQRQTMLRNQTTMNTTISTQPQAVKTTRTKPVEPSEIKEKKEKTLSNGFKVFIAALVPILPLLGSFIGLILSIIFINNKKSEDKQKFGIALLVESLIFLILSICFLIIFSTLLNGLRYELNDFFYYLR